MFNERPIWYYKLALGVVVFLDEVLKCEEVAHYLGSLGRELKGYSIEGFLEAQFRFGAIILRSNVSACSKEIFCCIRCVVRLSRCLIFENLLAQDK